MCIAISHVEYAGELIKKHKLRIDERRKAIRPYDGNYHFVYAHAADWPELPIIRMENPKDIQPYNWSIIPQWCRDEIQAKELLRSHMYLARCEDIFDKPSFRDLILTKRCLVPLTGFFEWREVNKKKYPYHIMVADEEMPDHVRPFYVGGVYANWYDKSTDTPYDTVALITTPANDLMKVVHNTNHRMPLILNRADAIKWLTPGLSKEQLQSLMVPYQGRMMAHTISKFITSKDKDKNVPDLLEPAAFSGVEDWIYS
jgi:putative SOS response-associated peptidase YedK